MGAGPLQELMQHFRAAVFATTETEMRAQWELVMQVLPVHDSCGKCCRRQPQPLLLCYMQCAEASDAAIGIQGSTVNYMNHILLDERRWAYWYRAGRLTLGIASTQRCEGFFGKLKLQLGLISSLQHLGATLHTISGCDEFESKLLTDSLSFRSSTQLLPGFDKVGV